MDSKWLLLATASILGQAPREPLINSEPEKDVDIH